MIVEAKHRMALVFRWYLGKSSRWAISGESARRADYQIWCGPAMGAFNAWVNITGLPSIQLPVHEAGGVPIGAQIVGSPFDESSLLRLVLRWVAHKAAHGGDAADGAA